MDGGTAGDSPLTSEEAGEIADLGLGPSWHCDGRITWALWIGGVREFTGWLERPTSRFPVRRDD
jgi:hypothetical protein